MKTLYLWFVLALALPLVWTEDEKCVCTFPNQMTGSLILYLKWQDGALRRIVFSYFEVDYLKHVAKLYRRLTSELFFLDFENMTMYRYRSSAFVNATSPNCRSVRLPDWMKIPGCVPSGLDLKSKRNKLGKEEPLYDTYTSNETEAPKNSVLRYRIYEVKHDTAPCEVTFISDTFRNGSTLKRIFEISSVSFVLNNPNSSLLPSTIDQCTPGYFPW